MRTSVLATSLVLLISTSGSVLPSDGVVPKSFNVRLTRVTFVPDGRLEYVLSPSELIVRTSTRKLHGQEVTDIQATKLRSVLAKIPLRTLQPLYRDPDVDDGARLEILIHVD